MARRDVNAPATTRGWRAAWSLALILVLALRLGLGLVMGATWLAVRSYVPAKLRFDVQLSGGRAYTLPWEAALAVWPRWDAVHYLTLARLGYFGVGEGDSVFYPLFPLLVRAAAPLVAGDYLVSGLVVSTLATVVALAMLYHLAERRYGPGAARWAVTTLAVYPTALFLVAPFTESLFIALTLGAFAAAGARRWWLSGGLAALASLTRGPGLLTAAGLAWLAWRELRTTPPVAAPAGFWRAAAIAGGLLLPVGGGAAFLLWRQSVGFPPMAETLRRYSGLELVDPFRGLSYALTQFVAVHDLPTSLDLTSVALCIGVLGAMIVRPRWRVGEWLIYMLVNLTVFLSKHSLVAASLQSLARYVLVLFPAFIVAGDWLAGQTQRVRFAYLLASSSALLVLGALYSMWWFIG